MEFVTNDYFWDCNCKKHFIHSKRIGNHCPKCKTNESDGMPDSRENEIVNLYDSKKDNAIFVRDEDWNDDSPTHAEYMKWLKKQKKIKNKS
jgi:hypothetical protein